MSGTRKMLLILGGGGWGSLGITIKPTAWPNPPAPIDPSTNDRPTQGQDYNDFIDAIRKDGWNHHAPSGRREITDWYLELERAIPNINPDMLLGHSMGGHLSMRYMEDHPNALKKAILFNVPLVYQSPDGLKECYTRAGLIKTPTYLIMSSHDDVLPRVAGPEIDHAIAYMNEHHNPEIWIRTLTDPEYHHSPFPPQKIALNILGEAIGRQAKRR